MHFIKYPSLTNHYAILNKKYINLENEYIATEKIHGANITIAIMVWSNKQIRKQKSYSTSSEPIWWIIWLSSTRSYAILWYIK